jgi:hypothetical protein
MHFDQEWVCVCGKSEILTQKVKYKSETLMDMWKGDKPHSSERFLNFSYTVLLLGVGEPAAIV